MWRNWYTRTLEVRVALPCEFESRHPHVLELGLGLVETVPQVFPTASLKNQFTYFKAHRA
jgi:hypothetical protein